MRGVSQFSIEVVSISKMAPSGSVEEQLPCIDYRLPLNVFVVIRNGEKYNKLTSSRCSIHFLFDSHDNGNTSGSLPSKGIRTALSAVDDMRTDLIVLPPSLIDADLSLLQHVENFKFAQLIGMKDSLTQDSEHWKPLSRNNSQGDLKV